MFAVKPFILCAFILGLTIFNCQGSPWSGMGVSCGPSDVLIDVKDDKSGCKSLAVKVKYCRGTCRSATKFKPVFPYFEPLCECCSATGMDQMTVELICPNGTRQRKKIETVKGCQCQLCGS